MINEIHAKHFFRPLDKEDLFLYINCVNRGSLRDEKGPVKGPGGEPEREELDEAA